jgi:hypothetical protein
MTIKYHIASDKGLIRFVRVLDKVEKFGRDIYYHHFGPDISEALAEELENQQIRMEEAIDTYLKTRHKGTESIPDLAQALVDQLFEETK